MRYVSSKDSTISFPDNFVKLEPKQSIHGLPVENGFQEVCEFLHLLGTLFLKIFFSVISPRKWNCSGNGKMWRENGFRCFDSLQIQ